MKIIENYKVYIHKNKFNNKVYVGITKRKPSLRWGKGASYKHNPLFYNAIQKYGWDNFEHKIVADSLTKNQAEEMEINLISELKATDSNYGYNIENGGNVCGTHSEYTKNKMRGKNNPAARKVICLTTNKIFDTAVAGAKHYGLKRTSVKDCCRGVQRTCGNGLKWMYYDEYLKYGDTTFDVDNTKKVICLETNKIFDSIMETAKCFDVTPSTISNCCSLNCLSVIKDNKKYHFMLYEDFLKYGRINFEKSKKNGKIICIPTKKVYDSILEAEKDTGVSCFTIAKKCRRMYYLNEKSDWMYYDDYVNYHNNKEYKTNT
jgi:hypothetical protein